MPLSDPNSSNAAAEDETRRPRVALVTGATGFVGRQLVEALGRTDWTVVGLARRGPTPPESERRRFVVADLREPVRVEHVLAETGPDYVLHLAAATPPSPDSRILAVNLVASTMLLEMLVRECPRARVLVVGSDAQYGLLDPQDRPTPETAPMRPVGTYGRSKVLQEAVALRYAQMSDLGVVCVRSFNVVGPGQSPQFLVGKLANRIARAEAGLSPPTIELGRLDLARDFTDVRDVAQAFVQALVRGTSGEVYNIGSGVPTTIGEVAETLASLSTAPITFRPVRQPFRPTDVEITQADASKLRAATGWAPTIPIEQSLADALDHARSAVARAGTTDRAGSPGTAGHQEGLR